MRGYVRTQGPEPAPRAAPSALLPSGTRGAARTAGLLYRSAPTRSPHTGRAGAATAALRPRGPGAAASGRSVSLPPGERSQRFSRFQGGEGKDGISPSLERNRNHSKVKGKVAFFFRVPRADRLLNESPRPAASGRLSARGSHLPRARAMGKAESLLSEL